MSQQNIYCGAHTRIPSSNYYSRLGTRKECLQKGIGVGKFMSESEKKEVRSKSRSRSNSRNNEPRLYCGVSSTLPEGYDRMGKRHECLKIGVGVGVRLDMSDEDKVQQDMNTIKKIANLLSIKTGRKSRQRLIEEICTRLTQD